MRKPQPQPLIAHHLVEQYSQWDTQLLTDEEQKLPQDHIFGEFLSLTRLELDHSIRTRDRFSLRPWRHKNQQALLFWNKGEYLLQLVPAGILSHLPAHGVDKQY
jgi:hypothetical protein